MTTSTGYQPHHYAMTSVPARTRDCETCGGVGTLRVWNPPRNGRRDYEEDIPCPDCKGYGEDLCDFGDDAPAVFVSPDGEKHCARCTGAYVTDLYDQLLTALGRW